MKHNHDTMKRLVATIAVSAALFRFPATAEQVSLGTNLVTIAFEDQTLSVEDRAFIAEEWRRTVAPVGGLFPPPAGETDYTVWESKADMPPLPAFSGTNGELTVLFSVPESAKWKIAREVRNSIGTAAADLDAFVTNQLSASSIAGASDSDLARLIITKTWAPGDSPELAPGQTSIRGDWFSGEFFLPPRFTLSFLDAGFPSASSNLWASIPVSKNGKLSEIPAVLYNGQWYLSQWFSEAGEKNW